MSYEACERETIIQTDDLSDTWNIYTRQRKLITKLSKQGYEPVKVEMEGDVIISAEFELPVSRISFRNANAKGRQMTDEQRQAASERMKKLRNS